MQGTSGALVAANLAACKQRPRVLLLDEGPDNKRPDLRVASERYSNVFLNPEIRTRNITTPQRHLHGRVIEYLQGRGLGGSSLSNFQAYIRGSASDYNEWAERVGDDFFAWENVERNFKELENLHFEDEGDENPFVRLKKGAHGFEGPVDLSLLPKRKWHHGMDKMMEAAIEFGWPVCRDQNSGDPIGVGCVTTTAYQGNRTTSASAYLNDPPRNLDIWCNAAVVKINFDQTPSGGLKVVGITMADGRIIHASKEVILSAGAICTPKLLLLSGIGPRTELRHLGIKCIIDHPQVGKNLIDHIWTTVHWSVSPEISDDAKFEADKETAAASRAEWLRSRTGHDAERNQTNLIAFVKFDPERSDLSELEKLPESAKRWIKKSNVPQIEIFLKAICPENWSANQGDEFMGLTIMLMNPQSRGEITLASKRPEELPIIDPGYFSHPYDRQTMIDGVREALTYVRSTKLANNVRKEVFVPRSDSDEDILDFCRENTYSVLHPCGTVQMGSKSNPDACLDTDFRLRGVENLRVIDLSAAPLITRYVVFLGQNEIQITN